MVTVMALGGSTNAVLHLIAMADSAGIELTLDDFQVGRGEEHGLNTRETGRSVLHDLSCTQIE